jgi:threonine dehydratase
MVTVQSILKAKTNFDPNIIRETPLEYSEMLSTRFGANVYLKREDLQPVRSYKIRGAYNFISSLSGSQKAK